MLFKEELQEIIKLTSNTLEAFTTALFLVKEERIILVAHHSLSPHMHHPISLKLEDGGILTLALDKDSFVLDGLDKKRYEIPYYSSPEDIKAFMAARVGEGKGILCVDSKRQYRFTEKHQKLLAHFSHFIDTILEKARDLRPKLINSGKYLAVTSMLQHLHPPSPTGEQLQEEFSKVMQDMGVEEAMVLCQGREGFKVALSYGSLSTEYLDRPLPIKGTPWQKVIEKGTPYVHKGKEKAPFIMGIGEARFPSIIIAPLERIPGYLGLASRKEQDLSIEVLDLVNILAKLLEPSLEKAQASSEQPPFPRFVEDLEKAVEKVGRGENALLLVACKVKNLEDLDKKMGVFQTEKLLRTLEEEFAQSLEGRVCLFRGNILVGYKVHRDIKFLEASGKAMEKNLPLIPPLNGTKAEVKVTWEVIPPSKKKGVEEAIQNLIKGLNQGKGLFRI